MKKIFITIFSILSALILLNNSDAMLLSQSPLELYLAHDLIVVGKIISLNEMTEERNTQYDIEVERYLKNPQETKVIMATGKGTKSSELKTSIDKIFEKGDRVLLYLNENLGSYTISPYSFNAANLNVESKVLPPPLKLWKARVDEIICRSDLVLVKKTMDGSPVCVKPSSLQRIITTGWAKS